MIRITASRLGCAWLIATLSAIFLHGTAVGQTGPGWGGVAACTQNTCGMYLVGGPAPPTCLNYAWQSPNGCRAVFGCYCDAVCEQYGDCCRDWLAVCGKPRINSILPATLPTAGGTSVILNGTFFDRGAGADVRFGGSLIDTVSELTDSRIVFTAPAGSGRGIPVVVERADGATSVPRFINYAPPVVTGIAAAERPTAGNVTLTITGNNFGPPGSSSVALVAGATTTLCPVTQNSHAAIECTLPPGQGSNLGIRVTTTEQLSDTMSFAYDAPEIFTISPPSAPATGGTTLTITGRNFGTTSSVTIGGANCPVTAQGHSQILCTLPAGSGSGREVRVSAGNQTSAAASFAYDGPQITSISPATGPTAGNVPITINGSGFAPGSSVAVGATNCPVVSQSGNVAIVCTLPAGQGAQIPVVVTGAGLSSNVERFQYAPPQVAAVSPTTAGTAGGTTLTITGSNFGFSPSVTVGTRFCPLAGVPSHSAIECFLPAGEGTALPVSVTVAGQASNEVAFSYDPPAIAEIFPTSGPTAGGIPLTINGSNFGLTATPTVGGSVCPVTTRSHTQLVCTLPAGTGSNREVVVASLGRTSNAATFSYAGPFVTSISPASGATAGNVPLTINGLNFAAGSTVAVGGSNCPVVSQSGTDSIVCTLPPGQGRDREVRVTSAGSTSNVLAFSYDAPVITAVTPANPSTAGGSILTLTGTSFGTSGSVSVAGRACPTMSHSHGMVTCILPAGQGTGLAVVLDVAGQTSNAAPFAYAAPVLAGISPTSGPAAGNIPLTLTGTNFGTASSVSIGGRSCPITSQGHTALQCNLPPGLGADTPVVVSAAGQASNPLSFAYPNPTLAGLSPANGPTDGGIPLTLAGTNFGSASTVSVGGQPCPVTNQAETSVVCTLPPGQGIARSVQLTTEGAASNTLLFDYDPPVISAIEPASGPTAGNVPITVRGTDFGTNASVTVGGRACTPILLQSSIGVACTLPPGTAGVQPLVLTVAGQSDTVDFTYADPTPTATATATPTATPTPLCEPTPRSDCRAPGKATLTVRDNADDSRDQLLWNWSRGEATATGDFGDPKTATDYRFCVYANGQPWLGLRVPPGGTCARDKPCWKTDKSPFRYADAAGSASGVTKLQLKAGEAGKASLQLQGKSIGLPDVVLPPQLPLTAQLVGGNGNCWSATFAGPPTKATSNLLKVGYKAP